MNPILTGSLSAMVKSSNSLKEICKSDLTEGDWIFVKTCNSLYSIQVGKDGIYSVAGGWFDRNGVSRMPMTIRGCTWGGSAIKTTVIAACGLRLEFGNRLVTSPIQGIFIVPNSRTN